MPLRIGFDMDGTLADFASAFHDVEVRLFGPKSHIEAGQPEKEPEEEKEGVEGASVEKKKKAKKDGIKAALASHRRRDAVWNAIRSTPDFWNTLKPIDPDAVKRIHWLAITHKWEVFFITQRPYTDGETVQRQTQHWLMAQGYDMPSVLVISGSRGAAAGALRLDYHVDDSPQNCLDVISESKARTILIVPEDDDVTRRQARNLKMGTATSVTDALDVLEKATLARTQPNLLDKIAILVGWK
ncbi:MAG TPA: hypothetical protein VNJ04_09770 [Gemmatimonadaceae bacterium]|nr:hypothetical protein [Gemmatimonadaceae bacterium]